MGWVISTLIVGAMAGSAFTQKTDKVGYVDFGAAFSQSTLRAKEEAQYQAKAQTLRDALNFIQLNDIFTGDQLNKLQSLLLKDDQTPQDLADIKKIEDDASAAAKQFDTLRQKPSPTPDETQQLNDLANRHNLTDQSMPQLQNAFTAYMQSFKGRQADDASKQIQAAVEKIAKSQGYTVVFSDTSAVYGGADLTDAVSKAIGK